MMAETTAISWADATFNPWIGCARVSPGCLHCYAEARDKRVGDHLWGVNAPRRRTTVAYWKQPLKWERNAAERGTPTLVFCASLADVFEDRADIEPWRADLFALIESTPHLIWQLLTKRPENVRWMVPASWTGRCNCNWPYPGATINHHAVGCPVFRPKWPANVWIGTTVEDQQRADERIPELLKIPAPVRFISCEPLLGFVDLSRAGWLTRHELIRPGTNEGDYAETLMNALMRQYRGPLIDWVIVGGESGPGFRALDLNCARVVVNQCSLAAVPVWFKQIGGLRPTTGGHLLDGREYHQMPAQAMR